ncbi:hypothetical protein DPEC_G00167540 [Dallia pectoralis]|uniref:Uncharacterized protein n=1 Tax=Dallia pectoralis TaxID=75939 RepID=A0ACC2GI23_DALPE|nr:hypothetical protein DPEC_G00167540 [Dallia pectoralis]
MSNALIYTPLQSSTQDAVVFLRKWCALTLKKRGVSSRIGGYQLLQTQREGQTQRGRQTDRGAGSSTVWRARTTGKVVRKCRKKHEDHRERRLLLGQKTRDSFGFKNGDRWSWTNEGDRRYSSSGMLSGLSTELMTLGIRITKT